MYRYLKNIKILILTLVSERYKIKKQSERAAATNAGEAPIAKK